MKTRITAISVLVFSLFPAKVKAWSEGGHRVIALIAYEKLRVEQRNRILEILHHHPRFQEDFEQAMPAALIQGPESDRQIWLFTQAAVWPDLVRNLPEPALALYHRPTWHHINLPVFLDEPSIFHLKPQIKSNQHMKWKEGSDPSRNNAAQTIDMALKKLSSPSTSDAQKALMICWLLHSTGDIHQPLHCVSLFSRYQFPDLKSGDMGGNAIPVTIEKSLKPQTLHSVWDGLLGYGGSLNNLRARAHRLLADPKLHAPVVNAQLITSLPQWIEEGRTIATDHVYTSDIRDQLLSMRADRLMPVTLPEEYLRQAGAIASQRASIAGHRLAGMLSVISK